MGDLFQDISVVTDRRTRTILIMMVPLSVLAAALELAGILLVVPLLAVISNTDGTETELTERLYELLETEDRVLVASSLALAVLLAFSLKNLVLLGQRWWSYGALADSESRTSERLFDAYLFAPYQHHVERGSTEAYRNLTDSVPYTYQQALTGLVGIVADGVITLLLGVVLFLTAPIAALGLTIYFTLVGLFYSRVILRRAPVLGEQLQVIAQDGLSVIGQTFSSIKQIVASNTQERFSERYHGNRSVLARTRRRVSFMAELPRSFLEMAFVVGVVLLTLAVLQLDRSAGELTVLVIFFAAGLRLVPALGRLLTSVTSFRLGRPAMRILASVTRELNEAAPTSEAGCKIEANGALVATELTYIYPTGATPALDKVSFSIERGTTTGIVGPSGAGKSTLIDLLLALYAPSSGDISSGGIPLASCPRAWRDHVGLVPQEVLLVDASVRENIAFGERPEDIDDARILDVVREAELEEFVSSLPSGLTTSVGERGVRLSGGQRQRVGIARALYRRPKLLLLDEATSALDTLTEQRIAQTIEALHGNTTIVMVAHRLSTVRNCDQIIYLVEGKVGAIGTFEGLIESDKSFAELVRESDLSTRPEASEKTADNGR